MEKVKELLKNPLYVGIGAGLIGLIIGWFVIGWGLWPVTYYDAAPENMRADLQSDYLRMAIDSFAKNADVTLAKARYTSLGAGASKTLDEIAKAPGKTFPDDINRFKLAIALPAGASMSTAAPQATAKPGEPTKAPEATKAGGALTQPTSAATPAPKQDNGGLVSLLLLLCVILLVVGAAIAAYFLVIRRKGGVTLPNFFGQKKAAPQQQPVAYPPEGTEAPIAQFMTTYKLGVDMYDDSFSIDSPTGEFLGECGVGISKHIGVGDPKKVTAFEVWLFDKNDIQTVTKVLMSDNAFNDEPTKTELKAKGEPILVTAGGEVVLETATLQLAARVVDMKYGQGALPQNSFFDQMTLELAIWPKPAA